MFLLKKNTQILIDVYYLFVKFHGEIPFLRTTKGDHGFLTNVLFTIKVHDFVFCVDHIKTISS